MLQICSFFFTSSSYFLFGSCSIQKFQIYLFSFRYNCSLKFPLIKRDIFFLSPWCGNKHFLGIGAFPFIIFFIGITYFWTKNLHILQEKCFRFAFLFPLILSCMIPLRDSVSWFLFIRIIVCYIITFFD